jgi:alpha,alpha-trehalase
VETQAPLPVGGHSLQLALRTHTFHLLQTASPHSIGRDASVPARGLHGEAYRGHIFWDEMYILPFYLLRAPEIARDILLYRCRRLREARRHARESDLLGAMFPWQSGSSGREETQVLHLNPKSGVWGPDRSQRQRHVGAAIARNAWSYLEATGDEAFLRERLAELLVSIGRFWASLATWEASTEAYIIDGVMGPDEFHEAYPGTPESDPGGLRNNVYTNVMAVWCIERGLDALRRLDAWSRDELRSRLQIDDKEIARWREIVGNMTLPRLDGGILEQFEGYGDLDELDWARYRQEHGNIGRLDRILKAEGDSPDHYKVSKQADLCMLFYVLTPETLRGLLSRLGYAMTRERARETIEYYRRRTSHGSTLSHVVFASILHRLDPAASWEHFLHAMASDLEDTQGGTTPEGIHAAVMAATVGILFRDYLGIRLDDQGVHFDPWLPAALRCIRCAVEYRGGRLTVDADRTRVAVTLAEGSPRDVPLSLGDHTRCVRPGETIELPCPPPADA